MAKEERPQDARMIHVRLPDSIHKRLRIRVAEEDTTIQDWVAALVEKELEKRGKDQSGH